MTIAWFYVEGNERVGPVTDQIITDLYKSGDLSDESYIWRKGFENWKKLKDVNEIKVKTVSNGTHDKFSWENVNLDNQIFYIKIGLDRQEVTNTDIFGPYTLSMLIKMFKENRINCRSYLFSPGLDEWILLGDTPLYKKFFSNDMPLIINEDEREYHSRPFIAKMFFHDESQTFEGVCREISVDGMQVLVANFPARVGDVIAMNVHPENDGHHFIANAQIVRLIEGGLGFSCRFNNLLESSKEVILNYIDANK